MMKTEQLAQAHATVKRFISTERGWRVRVFKGKEQLAT